MIKYFKQLTNRNYRVFLILLVLVAIGYANVVNGPMFFDDEHFIQVNKTIRSLKNIPEIYSSSVTEGAHISGNFYRPNQQLVYALTFYFFKLNPVPYHIIPILLHLLNAFFVFIILKKLSFSKMAGTLAAVLFLTNPVQTESVRYISGLAGPLGLFFLLSALIMYLKSLSITFQSKRYMYFGISALLYILSLFSKENMLVFLPLSVILLVFVNAVSPIKIKRYIIFSVFVFLIISVSYLFMRFELLDISETIGLTDKDNIYTRNLIVRLVTFINVLWDYVVMIIYPANLNYEKPYMAYTSLASLRGIFGMLLIIITVLSVIFYKRNKRVFLGICWFFCAMLPFTGIIPLNAMYLEHWLYIPIIGLTILIATLFDYLISKKRAHIFLYIIIPLIIFYTGRNIARNSEWADIEKFYLNELQYTDSSTRIYNNLGMYYADKKNFGKSIEYYNKAIAAGDFYAQPHHNLANIYLGQGDYNKAIEELYLALKINPDFIYSLIKLHNIYLETNQANKAARLRKLIENVENGRKNDFIEIDAIITE
ncbi:MAG: hypothetical protein K8S00_06815 [Bacteroidales bacterium]|nr:hypothetical protein [Bacteroidales bacterium]